MYPIAGLDYWTGLLDWTTGLTFDPPNGCINKVLAIFVAILLCWLTMHLQGNRGGEANQSTNKSHHSVIISLKLLYLLGSGIKLSMVNWDQCLGGELQRFIPFSHT